MLKTVKINNQDKFHIAIKEYKEFQVSQCTIVNAGKGKYWLYNENGIRIEPLDTHDIVELMATGELHREGKNNHFSITV